MCTYKINHDKNGVELYFKACPSSEIRETLKNAGWRWSRFGGCWYNRQTEENLQFAQALADEKAPEQPKEEKTNYNNLIKEFARREWGEDSKMVDYVIKSTAAAVVLENGDICGLDKPTIETRFCFRGEGADYELFKELHADTEKMRRYFMNENLRYINEDIEQAEKDDRLYFGFWHAKNGTAQKCPMFYNKISNIGFIQEGLKKHELAPDWTPATKEEREQVLKALKTIKADFEKRLSIWWKKYGAEKLTTWTYWADA